MNWVGELALNADNSITVVKVMWHGVFDDTGDYEGWKIVQNQNGHPSWGPPTSNKLAVSNHLLKPQS
jgi:hypothetical protein